MSRVYYCRLKNCERSPVNGGPPPNWCNDCGKPTLWRTEPWIYIHLEPQKPKGYVLSEEDVVILRVQGIKPE